MKTLTENFIENLLIGLVLLALALSIAFFLKEELQGTVTTTPRVERMKVSL